jgi:hypothetical protein
MLKRPRFWLWTAVVLLFLNVVIHSITLFISPAPQNETERQLIELMVNYRSDFGAGFHRNMKELWTALSSCFSLLALLGGLTLAYLGRQRVEPGLLKGVVGVHVIVFGITFVIMLVFTFLPPIILTGLIFLTLVMTFFTIGKERSNA